MCGWGQDRSEGPSQMVPLAETGSTGQITAARARLHSLGIVGGNLAEEAQMAADYIVESMKVDSDTTVYGIRLTTPNVTFRKDPLGLLSDEECDVLFRELAEMADLRKRAEIQATNLPMF